MIFCARSLTSFSLSFLSFPYTLFLTYLIVLFLVWQVYLPKQVFKMKVLYPSTAALGLSLVHSSQGQRISNSDLSSVNIAVFNAAPVNATGDAVIDGVNILQPYPATSSEKWSFSIKVRDAVPLTGDGQEGQQVAGTTVQLKAPDSYLNKTGSNSTQVLADPSWVICQHWWLSKRLRVDKDVVDPSCAGTLTNQCIRDLTRMITGEFNQRSIFRCGSSSLPSSCDESFGNGTDVIGGATLGMFTISFI
jgi:hypothetical protein